jgi:hypothetical protein
MSDKKDDFTMKISELLSFTKSNDGFEIIIDTISSILNEIIEENKENDERQSNESSFLFSFEENSLKNKFCSYVNNNLYH